MLRCVRYEFSKLLSNKLLLTLWLVLLVLNGSLFGVRQLRSNGYYFQNRAYYQAEEQRLSAMPPEQALEELNTFREHTNELWDAYSAMLSDLQVQKDIVLKTHPEIAPILEQFSGPEELALRLSTVEQFYTLFSWPQEYTEYVQYVQEESERMSGTSIFNKKDTFAANNVKKTGTDFLPCLNVQPEIGNQRFFEAFHSWNMGSILTVLLTMMMGTVLFLKEQESGMVYLIHATPNGRFPTAAAKLVTGVVMAAAIVVSFTGEEWLLSGLMYGFPESSQPVQSIRTFQECIYLISVEIYFLLHLLQKIAAMTMLVMFFAFLVPLFRSSQIVYLCMIAFGGMEYLFYKTLHPSSYLNILKFLNIFYLFSPANFFTEYQNLNFFGLALGIGPFLFAFWLCATVGFAVFYCLFSVRKPQLELKFTGFHKKVRLDRGSVSLSTQEGWRTLISGKGILAWVLAIFLTVSWYRDFPQPEMNQEEAGYRHYITQFGGKLTDEKTAEIEKINEEFEAIGLHRQELAQAYLNGMLSKEDYLEQDLELLLLSQKEQGFSLLQEQYFEIQMLQTMQGIQPVLLDQPSMDFLFGAEKRDFLVSLMAVLLLMMAILPMGHTGENMEQLIRSTPKGRLPLFGRRVLFSAVFAVCMLVGKWLPVFLVYARQYSIADWTAAAQHLQGYQMWFGSMTLGGFLALWITLQTLALLVFAIWFLTLSQTKNRTSVTALFCILVIFLTEAAFLAKIPGLCYINPAEAFSVLPCNLLAHWPVYMGALLGELFAGISVGVCVAKQ